eukprot:UN34219
MLVQQLKINKPYPNKYKKLSDFLLDTGEFDFFKKGPTDKWVRLKKKPLKKIPIKKSSRVVYKQKSDLDSKNNEHDRRNLENQPQKVKIPRRTMRADLETEIETRKSDPEIEKPKSPILIQSTTSTIQIEKEKSPTSPSSGMTSPFSGNNNTSRPIKYKYHCTDCVPIQYFKKWKICKNHIVEADHMRTS